MVDIPRRMIERSGPSLPSYERSHIFRAPPSSYFTRKKERVTEADVTWMVRPDGPSSDPTRINEAISYYAKGINPSVEVEYQNRGGGGNRTTHFKQAQAGSTYKLEVVRPPLFPAESLLPLSRPRIHQNKSVETNPGLPDGLATNTLAYDVDQQNINNAIGQVRSQGPMTVQATAYFKIDQPTVMSATWAINEDKASAYNVMTNPGRPHNTDAFLCRETTAYGTIIRPNYSAQTNPKLEGYEARNDDASGKVRESLLIKNVRPNFQLVIYDSGNHVASEVTANLRDKTNIALQASVGAPITLDRPDGTSIKLKDYRWTAVQTNVGLDQIILSVEQPDIQLERNIPLYYANTNSYIPTDTLTRTNQEYDLEGKIAVYANTNYDLSATYNQDETRKLQDLTKLAETLPMAPFEHPDFTPSQRRSSSVIPKYNTANNPTPRMRDNSRMREAYGQSFDRIFD